MAKNMCTTRVNADLCRYRPTKSTYDYEYRILKTTKSLCIFGKILFRLNAGPKIPSLDRVMVGSESGQDSFYDEERSDEDDLTNESDSNVKQNRKLAIGRDLALTGAEGNADWLLLLLY